MSTQNFNTSTFILNPPNIICTIVTLIGFVLFFKGLNYVVIEFTSSVQFKNGLYLTTIATSLIIFATILRLILIRINLYHLKRLQQSIKNQQDPDIRKLTYASLISPHQKILFIFFIGFGIFVFWLGVEFLLESYRHHFSSTRGVFVTSIGMAFIIAAPILRLLSFKIVLSQIKQIQWKKLHLKTQNCLSLPTPIWLRLIIKDCLLYTY